MVHNVLVRIVRISSSIMYTRVPKNTVLVSGSMQYTIFNDATHTHTHIWNQSPFSLVGVIIIYSCYYYYYYYDNVCCAELYYGRRVQIKIQKVLISFYFEWKETVTNTSIDKIQTPRQIRNFFLVDATHAFFITITDIENIKCYFVFVLKRFNDYNINIIYS